MNMMACVSVERGHYICPWFVSKAIVLEELTLMMLACVPLHLKFRRFTLSEMERMQTLPTGYTQVEGVSERQSKSCIGNGWTVDIIAHILSQMK